MPTRKEIHSKIITSKPHGDVKSSNTKKVHEFCEKMVLSFIYNFFMGYFFFLTFIVKVISFAFQSSGKLATKCSAIFLIALSGSKIKLILKLLILGAFLGISLLNESMTPITYPKLYGFDIISYTTH